MGKLGRYIWGRRSDKPQTMKTLLIFSAISANVELSFENLNLPDTCGICEEI